MRFVQGRGWIFWSVLIGSLIVVGAGGFLGFQLATAASLGDVYPPRDGYVNSADLVLLAAVPNYKPGSGTVQVLLDGQAIDESDLSLSPGKVSLTRRLLDGPHNVRVELTSSNVFSRRLVQQWSFTVDTKMPEVEILAPRDEFALGFERTAFRARFTEAVEASLELDGSELPLQSDGDTVWTEIEAESGKHELVLRAHDPAGNQLEKRWDAWADFEAPKLILQPDAATTWKGAHGEVRVLVADNLPDGYWVRASLNGQSVAVEETGPPEPAAGSKKGKATTTTAPQTELPGGRWFGVQLKDLPEGTHLLAFSVTDRGGHFARQELPFLVDSTETFGARPLQLGARGRDAKQLNQILIRKGLLEGKAADVFDERTGEAVKAFRKARGKEEVAVLNQDILPALVGSIKIDISERKLYLYDEDKLVKTYRVAVGQPQYPTPTGNFRIVVKEYNPTWNPPPSPWAAGQEPVPPGPGNPLGTRWMGISAYAIGIHGTYASGSIGTAASHGCIRMRIPEVEELFELVYVGTPVSIVR